MRSRRLVSILVGTFVSVAPSFAQYYPQPNQAPIWVGIDREVGNAFAQVQEGNELCWAASVQFILNYYQIPITQAQVVQRIDGAFVNKPGTDIDISESLNQWSPIPGGMRVVHAVENPGLPPPHVLIQQLYLKHPILIAFMSGPYSGHAVVITAAAYVPGPAGPTVTSLVTRDPWPSPDHLATVGRVEYDGVQLFQFAQLVRANWIVWEY